jgi:hypothetical protein
MKKRPSPTLILVLLILGLLVVYSLINAGRLSTAQQEGGSGARPTERPTEALIYAKDQVQILDGWECSHDGIGNMIVEDKVKNTGPLPLRLVEIRATIYTQAGQQVNTYTGFVDSDVLEPGASSTFDVYVDDPQNEAKRCGVKVEDAYFQR